MYYEDVNHLYYEKKLSIRHILRVIPVSKNTISRWIRTFAIENNLNDECLMRKRQLNASRPKVLEPMDVSDLRKQLTEMRMELRNKEKEIGEHDKVLKEKDIELHRQRMRADFYDEMINVAELSLTYQ